ncbi:hypothetical protein HQ496_09465 [bacterium]|nr:hypothetical protein [bacterium]
MITPLAKIRPIRPQPEVLYNHPTLDELVQLCKDFGLINEIASSEGHFHITCKDEKFSVTPSEAETLVRGLLIGYFAFQTRDDLALADWLD